MRVLVFIAFLLLTITAQAGDSEATAEIKRHPDFFSKMEMIEKLSTLEALSDKDIETVMKSRSELPKAAQLEDDDQQRPTNPDVAGDENEK